MKTLSKFLAESNDHLNKIGTPIPDGIFAAKYPAIKNTPGWHGAIYQHMQDMDKQGKYTIRTVPISSLNATQLTVQNNFQGVAAKNKPGKRQLPLVVRYEGQDNLHDGHHRAMTAAENGATHIEVKHMDVDAYCDKLDQEYAARYRAA